MALYYFNIQPLTRNKHSVIAKASYVSGESLYSERDLETKSYGIREVQPDSFILAPEHAPGWVMDREQLWNQVEVIENRYNSRLAKEIKVALPIEISNDEQRRMVTEFVKENIVSRGIVADVSIHRDRDENPHAHILITTRPFNEDGTWGNKKKREYVYDQEGNPVLDKHGKKKFETIQLTDWDRNETLLEWRKNFAEKINEFYKKNSVYERVSHESYEAQGIEKLPKQRLTRQEYAIEKRAKEEALKSGTEYKAVTTYGKINQEIENTNKKLEIINRKIVSLSDYRKQVENEQLSKLNQIRKTYNLSNEDWKSLKVVGQRVSGFVDINNAKDNLEKLSNWKKKIDYVGRLLKAEEKVLSKAKLTYEKEPSKVLLYGFIPNKFKDEFTEKVSAFSKKIEAHKQSLSTFNELQEHSKRAYEIQKEFTNEEFKFLYPHYDQSLTENNESITSLKAKYVELFRQEGRTRDSIPEMDHFSHKLTDEFVRLDTVLKDWKETNNSLVILERSNEKRKGEIKEHYHNFIASKLYQAQIVYADTREQIVQKEEQKAQIQSQLMNEMAIRYPGTSKEMISEIPADIQSKLLSLHLSSENTGKLSSDLKLVQEKDKYHRKNQERPEFKDNDSSNLSKDTAMLFNALIGMAQSNENHHDDLEEQRRKRRKNKLYREMGEQEL